MHIKRYTIASFILIALLGWIGTFSTQTVNIDIFGVILPSASVSIVIMIPLVILYIASFVHISFYSIIGSFKLRKYEKDYEQMINSIVDAFLNKKERNHIFKTKRYKTLGLLVDNSIIYPTNLDTSLIENEKIRNVMEAIEDIKQLKVVDMKKFALSIDNPLIIQNERNKFKNNSVSAEDFLSHPDKYNKDFLQEIYIEFIKISPLYAIEKYKNNMTRDALFGLLSRINSDEHTLEISNESLINLFETLELNSEDYISISKTLSMGMLPEQRIKLLEMISDTKDEAMDAYLFTLFDLEMMAPAIAILDISQTNEYLNFKAYRALKESNKNFNINLFV